MKKLIVYGDSFAANNIVNDFTIGWSILLAAKLKIPYINNAIGGSSIEYSIKKFIMDTISNELSADDIIIFVFSNPGRHHLNYQTKKPNSAATFSSGTRCWKDPLDEKYYHANEYHIRWYEANKDEDIFKINASAYIHMLNNYARNNPSSIFVILNMNTLYHPIDVPILDNFLISNISLLKISNNEFVPGIDIRSFKRKTITDPRLSHLTIPNMYILADLLYKVILNKDTSIITYDSFLKNILDKNILSQEDYCYLIDRNLLYNTERYMDRLI